VEGRSWESVGRVNLLFTIILKTPTEDALKLNLVFPIAIAFACRQEGVNAWIKWPNDVWVGSKKVSGMLIDCSTLPDDDSPYQLVGIGVNINENFECNETELQGSARSLRNFLNVPVSREMVLANICNHVEPLIKKKTSEILEEYKQYEKLTNRTVIVYPKKKENLENELGTAIGFSELGFLQVKINQIVKTLSAEEVSVRPEDVKDLESKPLLEVPEIGSIITGKWQNQLGSIVYFTANSNGELCGKYNTAVGNASKEFPLHGSWCSVRDGGGLISFTVAWARLRPEDFHRSTTAWSGRLYLTPIVEIVTTWTLTSEEPRSDQWKSILLNKDVFHKVSE